MSEMTSGLRLLEMHERQAFQRARAQREQLGAIVDTANGRRNRLWNRAGRRAA